MVGVASRIAGCLALLLCGCGGPRRQDHPAATASGVPVAAVLALSGNGSAYGQPRAQADRLGSASLPPAQPPAPSFGTRPEGRGSRRASPGGSARERRGASMARGAIRSGQNAGAGE